MPDQRRRARLSSKAHKAKTISLAVASCFAACVHTTALANPNGFSIVNGQATFNYNGNTLTITNTPGSIINWRSFSIGAGELTRFIQQSAASSVLNRVIGVDPSLVLGALQSNGRVFLINPNGILFGQNSRVDVAGLVASSLNISDRDFLAGKLKFIETAGAGGLVNQGAITTPTGGQVYLIAPNVENHGLIQSPQGTVILAAGKSVEIVDAGTPNLRVKLTARDNHALNVGQIIANSGRIGIYAGLIRNSGVVRADGVVVGQNGEILLKATQNVTLDAGSLISASGAKGGSISIESAAGLTQLAGAIEARGEGSTAGSDGGSVSVKADRLINTGLTDASGAAGGSIAIETDRYVGAGTLKASGTAGDGGSVSLLAHEYLIQSSAESLAADGGASGAGGTVSVQAAERVFSSANLSAQGAGKRGGEIRMLADELLLFGASIDASGAGGGTILVGGDYQGRNPDIQNASRTWVNYSTIMRADATQRGDGGKVIVWSDQDTRYAGHVSARGGAQSGNGGLIEVSGKESLIFAGTADAGATHGAPGTLLLDPKNIVIDSAGGGVGSFLLVDPNPGAGDFFAQRVIVLPNDNVVATDPADDLAAVNAGAVYLFNGSTGALISTLIGSTANDGVGVSGVTALSNGNYVVSSSNWSNGAAAFAGAVTFGSGTTGVSGAVSAANSLVGTTANDIVGLSGVTALSNGNYVVSSVNWRNGAATGAGAVTFGNGTTGVSGAVSPVNSLVGTAGFDNVGNGGVTALSNGNYVVSSPNWRNGAATNAGAVTFGNGSTGVSGAVSAANSLVGTTGSDFVGSNGSNGVTALSNGNYVVSSPGWDNAAVFNAGAVTFGSGTTGVSGAVSAANSLVGTTAFDAVGLRGVTALGNGNYVVNSPDWNNGAGAVTFGSGTTGISGGVSAANSLVGTTASDAVGLHGVTALSNGNYVVSSPNWNNGAAPQAGAVTFGSGTTGISGAVSAANSLVGTTANDQVGFGGLTALSNGNYVVSSRSWNNGAAAFAGAVTFGSGTTGISGAVSAANSLVGTTANDQVGFGGVTALSNGNYVVRSPFWNNGAAPLAGAVTFGSGTTGVSGAVSVANSLVGTTAFDFVGFGVTALSNGNYVVSTSGWNNGAVTDAGAVTFGSGTTGISGAVSAANSLVGTAALDSVGIGVTALSNGNYVVRSPFWNNGAAAEAGAVTFGSGTTGVSGAVSAANSLVGTTAFDNVGNGGVTALSNGNYVVSSPTWNNGVATRAGSVTFGSGTTGVSGTVSAANSLVGTTANDQVGSGGVTPLSNGNVVVRSPLADNGAIGNAGLVHVLSPSGAGGFTNPLTFADNAAGNATITPAQIIAITNTGTAVTLQANNDITLNPGSDISTSAGGAGGDLTMQAGRSVLLNSDITTDNGNFTLVANDPSAIAVNREPGAAVISIAPGSHINAGMGTLDIRVSNGSTAGDITTGNAANLMGGQINLQNTGGGNLNINGNITASGFMGLSGGNVNITDANAVAGGSVMVTGGNLNIIGNAVDARLQAGTDLIVAVSGNVNVQGGANASAQITNGGGSGLMDITVGGNIVVTGGTGSGFAQIYGAPNVNLTLTSSTSEIQLNATQSSAYARIWAESPTTIQVKFPLRSGAGYFVNGVKEGIFDPTTISGFYVGTPGFEVEAVLGSSLLIEYGITTRLPDSVLAALNFIACEINNSTDPIIGLRRFKGSLDTSIFCPPAGKSIFVRQHK